MKTLYLLRHAKSSWGDAAVEDHDRPLNARGIENAAQMGQLMRKEGYNPALILCSSARRTRETLDGLAPSLPANVKIRHEPGLYLAPRDRMLSLLRETDDAVPSVLIIAHSPGTEELALGLARSEGSHDEDRLRDLISTKFPTAALAVLRFPVETWRLVKPDTGELLAFVRPRDL